MLNARHLLQAVVAAVFATQTLADDAPPRVDATFIQLHRGAAEKSVEDWSADIEQMKAIGIRTLIVQWTAEHPVSFFKTDEIPFEEQYDVIERLFAAVRGKDVDVVLGLEHSPIYWSQLEARDRVLRDYLYVRAAQNERLQKALLKAFKDVKEWTGYYIVEEIDDKTWRNADRAPFMKTYISLMCERIRANDKKRDVMVSTFFRGRTAPDIYARTLHALVAESKHKPDVLMLQDGTGVNDPPEEYVPLFFREVRDLFTEKQPALWCVVETFSQLSKADEPFKAAPADADRVTRQIERAAPFFDRLALFTFLDYSDPDLGGDAAKLYERLVSGKDAPPPAGDVQQSP